MCVLGRSEQGVALGLLRVVELARGHTDVSLTAAQVQGACSSWVFEKARGAVYRGLHPDP